MPKVKVSLAQRVRRVSLYQFNKIERPTPNAEINVINLRISISQKIPLDRLSDSQFSLQGLKSDFILDRKGVKYRPLNILNIK